MRRPLNQQMRQQMPQQQTPQHEYNVTKCNQSIEHDEETNTNNIWTGGTIQSQTSKTLHNSQLGEHATSPDVHQKKKKHSEQLCTFE